MTPRVRRALVVLAAVAAVSGACSRGKPRLVPADADSALAGADSFAMRVREAQSRWDEGASDAASNATADVLFDAILRRPEGPWADRTRGLADSLGFGAEVAGNDHIALVNLFARTDAEGRTWPHLFWRDASGPRRQLVEGSGLHLHDLATSRFDGGTARESSQTAALWGRRSSAGQQPLVMVWRHGPGGRWDLLQTLGPDSLGGTGEGAFVASDSSVDLTTRTFRPTPYFDECATCPHVYRERRFTWGPNGFVRATERLVPSAYATFAGFVQSLVAGDREAAALFVVDPMLVEFARRYEWDQPSRGRWRVAPATSESASEMLLYRGPNEAFRVAFEAREGAWRVAGFEQTSRVIE